MLGGEGSLRSQAWFRYHVEVSEHPAAALVAGYLSTLEQASASTRRQRSWALRELLDFALESPSTQEAQTSAAEGAGGAAADGVEEATRDAGSRALSVPGAAALLDPALVATWMAAADEPPRAASLPGLRARASAVRALARYAEQAHALAPGTADALSAALALPTPVPSGPPDAARVRHLLVAADPDALPPAVLPSVWARFCAHVHLLALTGAGEDVLAALPLCAVEGTHLSITTASQSARWRLSRPAQTALKAWLPQRAAVAATLRGAPPEALWLRVRPSADHRTGALRPAGLPLSARGLRLAFTTTVALLQLSSPALVGVTTAEVRKFPQAEPELLP